MSSRHQHPIAAGKSSFDLVDHSRLFAALARLLPPGGNLAVIEFVREESSPGPPCAIRLAPVQLEALIVSCGFRPQPPLPVAEHLYLMLFERC